MSKTLLVAKREYLENMRTKTFWIGILMFPVLLSISILLPVLLDKAKDARRYAVLDHSGFLFEEVRDSASTQDLFRLLNGLFPMDEDQESILEKAPAEVQTVFNIAADSEKAQLWDIAHVLVSDATQVEGLPKENAIGLIKNRMAFSDWWRELSPTHLDLLQKGLDRSRFQFVDYPDDQRSPQILNEKIQRGELFAYFEIGPDPIEGNDGCRYISNNLTDRDLLNWFNGHASPIVKEKRIELSGIEAATARWINQSLEFETHRVGETGAEEKVQAQDTASQWAPVAFVYILWIAIFSVAQILLTNTIEEKSNRIIEVLLSSVSAFQLMSGKIIGNAATGLTVIGSWIGFLLLGVSVIPLFFDRPPNVQLEGIVSEPLYLGSFLVYFILGYFLYAALLVAIGSVCTNPKEAQNLMLPVMLILLVPLMSMMPVAQDPNGALARVLSYIPVFTPFVMMNRAAGPPPLIDYVGTTLLLLISLPLFFWGASRIFRIGVLMTGQPPKLSQILKWLFIETHRASAKK